jgi:hypothetical protein
MPTDNSLLGVIPPGVDPGQWLKTQRQMQLAQALQGFSLSPVQNDIQQPGGGGKYYQAARVRPIAALSKLAEALMAKRNFDQAAPAMAQQYSQGMQAFAPGGQPSSQGDPTSSQVVPVPSQQPPISSQNEPQPAGPQQASPANPMNPVGLPPAVAMRMYMSDPAKYGELLAGTPEWRTALAAAAGDPNRAMAMLRAENAKKATTEARPGSWVQGPDGQWKQLPQGGPGQHLSLDAQGNVSSSTIAGYNKQAADLAAAEAAAKNANTEGTFPTQGGGTRVGWTGDVLGPPPGARQPDGSAPPGKYFGAPPVPQMPSAPSSANKTDPFPDAPRAPSATGLGGPSIDDKVMQDARAKERVDLYKKFNGESDLADATLMRISEAQNALEKSNAGPLSSEMTHVQAVLHQLAPSIFDGEAATNTQIANKNLVTIALNGAKGIYGPRMTSSEVMLQKNEASPSTEQTREAAQALLKQQAMVMAYQKQRAQDYQKYVDAGHDPLRFEGWYSGPGSPRSMQSFAMKHDTDRQSELAKDRGLSIPPAAFDKLTQHPELKPFFQQKYGYVPDGY